MTDAADDGMEARIDALLQGAIDPHVHSGPSVAPRLLDHLELLREASEAGFAAVVTKDHDYSGVMAAEIIRRHHPHPRTQILSSIVLNNVVGGMNPYAVEHMAAMGGKIVWMPTLSAENHLRWQMNAPWAHPAASDKVRPPVGIPVLTSAGEVRDDVKEILDIIARHDLVLASGHLHVSETWKVFEEAQKRGVTRRVLTHPEEIVGASLADVAGLAASGAMIEHSLSMVLDGSKFQVASGEDLRRHISAAGVDRTMLCSDLGQMGVFRPVEGFRRGIRLCIDLGYSDGDIRKMVSLNAARLLGIEIATPQPA